MKSEGKVNKSDYFVAIGEYKIYWSPISDGKGYLDLKVLDDYTNDLLLYGPVFTNFDTFNPTDFSSEHKKPKGNF